MYLDKRERDLIERFIKYLKVESVGKDKSVISYWLNDIEIAKSILNKANIRAKQKSKINKTKG